MVDDTIAALITNSNYAENEIAVDKIFIEKVLTDSTELSPAEFDLIESISSQCPYEGGPAVYLAREIHSFFNHDVATNGSEEWDDEAICTLNGVPMRSKKPESSIRYTAYPNPSNGTLFVKKIGKLEDTQYVSIEVLDGLGSIVLNKSLFLKEGEAKLDITDVQNGLYTILIRDQSGNNDHLRVILLK